MGSTESVRTASTVELLSETRLASFFSSGGGGALVLGGGDDFVLGSGGIHG